MKSIPVKSAIRGNYFFYSFAIGCAFPFLAVFFKDIIGASDSQLGFLLMIRPAVAILFQPFWSVMADTGGHRGRLAFVLALISCVLFPLVPLAKGLLILVGLLIIWSIFNAPLNTVNDAIAFQYLGHHKRMRFAHFRIFASFGWIIAVLLVGKIYDRFGVQNLFMAYSFGIVIAAFFLWRIPKNEKTTWNRGLAAVRELLTKRNVIFFLIAVFIFETANQMGYAFLSVYSRSLGASYLEIGWIWAIATFSEMVTMLTFVHIIKRINLKNVLLMAMILTIFRWVPFGWMHVWWQLLPLQMLHAFTLTFGYVGAATFLDMESSAEIRFSAQAFYSTFILNGAAIGGAVFGGQISQYWGYSRLYLTSGILAFVAAVIMAVFVKNPQSEH